ncbi:YbaB/EbfC family DNA-binding protein [Paraburkholderia sp. BCC1885]|uniref:YbaB/EbfC family DNA-binding protein n=1 Tax=Paraburkholderia sp. BCC1885 TaxID=2562669 RepID=UPI001183589E|nr:YbaB/EbfC family DNA-binding protein [Paraburkholderia sp. BCC1885]
MRKSGKWSGFAAGLFGLVLSWTVPAWGQASAIPEPWIAYAQLVGHQFQVWLEADDDTANQLHGYLENRILNAKGDAPPPAIVIRAWIDPSGQVSRVDFDSLGDPKADAILRQLLTTHPITEPPPSDMRQPLRVRLHLEANPDAQAPASGFCGAREGCPEEQAG